LLDRSLGTTCGHPDVLAFRHVTQGAGVAGGTCGMTFGSCASLTYYDLYRDEMTSFKVLPHLDRLTGNMTEVTRSFFGFPSPKRFHVQYTTTREAEIDPDPLSVGILPNVYYLDRPPCGPDGDCGWNMIGPSLMEGNSRIVIVADHNYLTIQTTLGRLKEPAVCDLDSTWTPASNNAQSTRGTLNVRFANCGNLDDTFFTSASCSHHVDVLSSPASLSVVSGTAGSHDFLIDLLPPFSPGTFVECNVTVSLPSKPRWNNHNKSATISVSLPLHDRGFIPCDSAVHCSGHGTCDSSGNCNCTAPFQGVACSACPDDMYGPACDVYCHPDTTCSSRGFCHPSLGLCVCNSKWTGSDCSLDACKPFLVHSFRALSAYNFYEERSCPQHSVLRCKPFPHALAGCTTTVCACYCLLPFDPRANPCNLSLAYDPFWP
jgi:hypothetical protein